LPPSGKDEFYTYDGTARRITRTMGDKTENFYYNDSWQLLETRTAQAEPPSDKEA
jgi:hypothetical protein